jgi:hypothetical protein
MFIITVCDYQIKTAASSVLKPGKKKRSNNCKTQNNPKHLFIVFHIAVVFMKITIFPFFLKNSLAAFTLCHPVAGRGFYVYLLFKIILDA